MTPLHIAIIVGSTRPNRFSEKPAQWIFDEAKKREGVEVELLDLRDQNLPMFDQPKSTSGVKDGNYGDEAVNAWAKKIAVADAFIMVGPEYNHGPSAVLKNALDSIYAEWNNKVVGFVSYGSVGGARAVEQLRLVTAELQMASVRQGVYIPGDWVWGGLEWNPTADEQLMGNAKRMLDQLILWGNALKGVRG